MLIYTKSLVLLFHFLERFFWEKNAADGMLRRISQLDLRIKMFCL